jgi:hypothetical protein
MSLIDRALKEADRKCRPAAAAETFKPEAKPAAPEAPPPRRKTALPAAAFLVTVVLAAAAVLMYVAAPPMDGPDVPSQARAEEGFETPPPPAAIRSGPSGDPAAKPDREPRPRPADIDQTIRALNDYRPPAHKAAPAPADPPHRTVAPAVTVAPLPADAPPARPAPGPDDSAPAAARQPPPAVAPTPATSYKLGGILRGGGLAHALVNGTLVTVGDEVDGATVIDIGQYHVVVQTDRQRIVLRM